MRGLVEYFLERIPSKIDALLDARRRFDDDPAAAASLRRIAHSLRGSAGSYGFPQISAAAGLVETSVPERIDDSLDALIATLRSAIEAEAVRRSIVLVVADESDALAIRDALGQAVGEIRHAATGEEALRALQDGSVGLVITDLVLSDLDGRSLLIKIRENPATAATPVFVTATRWSDRIKAECLALGAQQFIEKPFNAELLSAATTATLQLAEDAAGRWSVDPLTGLPNRAAFGEAFRRASAYAFRNGRPLTVGILDLDRFKSVNDVHGHAVGDAVLQGTAATLLHVLRESDSVARWGGEEFVALFPDTPERGGVAAFEKVQETLATVGFDTPSGRALNVSFSAGVSQVRERESLGEALTRADGHLYRAKAAGRSRVFCADSADTLPTATVLLVEDDDAMATLIESSLASTGTHAEILRCRDGEEALDRLGDASVALGILDVNMPGMDGFTLLERMRANPAMASIPIVMLTGRGSEEDVVRGLSLGADDYIVKPFSVAELSLRVHRLLKAS